MTHKQHLIFGNVIYLENGTRVLLNNLVCIVAIKKTDFSHFNFHDLKKKKQEYRYELYSTLGSSISISSKDYEVIKQYVLKLKYPLFMTGRNIINTQNIIIEPSRYPNTSGWLARYTNDSGDYISISEYEYQLIKARDLKSTIPLDVEKEFERLESIQKLNQVNNIK